MEKRKLVVELIFEKFNLLSDADFKSWMLNNHEELYRLEREQMRKTYSHGWTTRERFDDLVSDIIYPLGLDYEEKQEYAFQQYYNQTYGGQDE